MCKNEKGCIRMSKSDKERARARQKEEGRVIVFKNE